MDKRWWLGMGLWLVVACALAGGHGAARKQVEASMRVTGTLAIRADGSVTGITLDKQEQLAADVAAFVRAETARWRFEPMLVAGQPGEVKARTSILLIGTQTDDGKVEVAIRGADFGGGYESLPADERLTPRQMKAPGYPQAALEQGAQGTVYLLLAIAPDGQVSDVAAEQVNLRHLAGETQMARLREHMARVSLAAARRWSFNVPTAGEHAGKSGWVLRVPVDFTFAPRRYGQWDLYVPGPREKVAWAGDEPPGFSPDTLAEGGVHMAGTLQGPRLLTPLQPRG